MKMTDGKSERFSLRWDNFHSNLSTSFHTLLQGEELVDVTIAAEGRFVQAHKLVLSVCSPYFKSLFKVNPCKHPIVILKDVGHKELVDILEFMYRGEVNVSQEDLTEFLKTAELLQVKGLTGDDTPGDSAEQEIETKDTPAEPPPGPQTVKIKTSQKSPSRVVASPRPSTPQPAIKTETTSNQEVVQPPPQKRMRQEPRQEPQQEHQEQPQYVPPRRSPSVPHVTMPQTSTPSRKQVTSASESSKDVDYPSQELEYVEMPNPKTEPVEIDSDIEEVDATFDDGSDFSEFFGGQSSQSFQDFSAVGLPDGQSGGASQSMGIPLEGEQDTESVAEQQDSDSDIATTNTVCKLTYSSEHHESMSCETSPGLGDASEQQQCSLTSNGTDDAVEYIRSYRGRPQLVYKDFIYCLAYTCQEQGYVRWTCSRRPKKKCQARLTMEGKKMIEAYLVHNHDPQTMIIKERKERGLKFLY